jgi:hypothetical protein
MKFFVLDSIARSGTTLLSAILRSLNGCNTLDAVFMEPFACEKFDGLEWSYGYGDKALLSPTEKPNLSIDRLKDISSISMLMIFITVLQVRTTLKFLALDGTSKYFTQEIGSRDHLIIFG